MSWFKKRGAISIINGGSRKNYNFQKLTPIKNVDLRIYNDALNFVFDNEDIKNVAISGAYSSGKSSVIETYKIAHPDINFIHISLAHFESTKPDNDYYSEHNEAVLEKNIPQTNIKVKQKECYFSEFDEVILERKILNQLIHKIDSDKIPQTNFKIKQKVSTFKMTKSAATITLFAILAVYIGCFNSWCQFVSVLSPKWLKNILLWTTNKGLLLLCGIVCAAIFGLAVYSIIKTQKNKNIFRKLNLHGNEIEIFEENDATCFDKYLDEVLYIFENSGANAIVFEDMDRYNVNKIFEKLREINTLVNHKKEKPIRFFYLLRDDLFISKDRTKFFDFVIPILPILDSSNSYDKFIEHFKQGEIFNKFDEKFLQGLSLYVDDMRILKNIYNEFVVYQDLIHSIELDSNKLLAMIAYKNIFPRDFSDLQLGMGFVHTLFESKAEIIKQEIQITDSQIQNIKEDIRVINKELLDSIDDLDAVYLLSNYHIITIASKNVSAYNTRALLVKAIRDNPNDVIVYQSNYGNRQINMTSEFEQLLQNPDYVKRKETIERKSGGQIEELNAEIRKLQQQKSVIQNNRLKWLITLIPKENIDTIFNVSFKNGISEENKFEEIKTSPYFPLIKYLIRNGYIDETYQDYMTYFYEDSLSHIDKIFLRSITDETPKEYAYSLNSPKLVISKLSVADFGHEEILNFDLLCHLLKTKESNTPYLNRFLQQLAEIKNYKFIGEFLEMRRDTDVFIESINHIWPSIMQGVLTEIDFSDAQKKQYVIDTLYFSTDADIEALNENSCLTAFISDNPNFLDIDSPNVNKIISGFTLLAVQFAWINYDASNKDLFNAVYKNNQYQLTFALISLMLEKIYNFTKSNDFKTKNYTLIFSKPNEPLASHINEDINMYIGIILENCDNSIDDEELAVLTVLNSTEIEPINIEKYISVLQTVIEHISDINNKELWSLLLQQKRVKYSDDNILNYFYLSEKGLDAFLIKFINSNEYGLKFNYDSINHEYDDNAASKFYSAIVNCNELSNEKYETILFSLHSSDKSFQYQNVADEKIIILIKLGVIQMTDDNLHFMRENYPDHLMPFITKNIVQYSSTVINNENFDLSEMLSVLEEEVSDKFKMDLLQYATERISIQQKKYPNIVKMHILEHNLDVTDIPFLLKVFPHESLGVKERIKNIAIKNINEIINKKYSIPLELFSELLATNDFTEETKQKLFILCLPNMNEEQTIKYLRILQMEDFISLFDRKRPKFEINNINQNILQIFQEKKWITNFEIDKDKPEYYRAYGRKRQEYI